MAHVKRGATAHARHKKVLKLAKGYEVVQRIVFVLLCNGLRRRCSTLTRSSES